MSKVLRAEPGVAGAGGVSGLVPGLAATALDRPTSRVGFARWSQVTVDTVALTLVAAIGVRVWGWMLGAAAPRGTTTLQCWWPFVPSAVILMAIYGLYRRPGRRVRSLTFLDLAHLFHSLTLAGLASLAASGLLHRLTGAPKLTWSEVAACAIPALIVLPAVRAALTAVMDGRGIPRTRIIMVGSGVTAHRVAARLARFGDVELVGWADHEGALAMSTDEALGPHLGAAADLAAMCLRYRADRVLIALDGASRWPVVEWFRGVPPTVRVGVVPPFSEVLTCRSELDELHGLAVLDLAPPPAGAAQRLAKRAFDIVAGLSLLIICSPFFAVIALVIRRGSPGPVFFRQIRAGRGRRPFVVYKFRTMAHGAEDTAGNLRPYSDVDGPIFKLHADPRVTPAGRFLRRFSFDELPQLLNVLRGEMSLVGPRPFPIAEADEIRGWAERRFDVRPGMTGYWQVSGRNDLTFAELQQLDYAYVAAWSLWWDLKILWQTPGAVLARRGAY